MQSRDSESGIIADDAPPPGEGWCTRGGPVTAEEVRWPEWLTPEYSAIHTAFENEIVKALEHCYASADAAGMDWTTEGWVSCSASNIMGLLHRLGCPPPPVELGVERLSLAEVERHWSVPWDEEDEPLDSDGDQ